MYTETLDQINRLANERLSLYRLVGKERLTSEQVNRIQQITNELPILWDRHRRELAAERYSARKPASRLIPLDPRADRAGRAA